jgi:hypothetical protein
MIDLGSLEQLRADQILDDELIARLIPLTQVGQHIALVHGARTLTEPIPARVSERRELRRVSRGAAVA